MDDLGEAYGTPGDDAGSPANSIFPDGGVIDLPDDQHMWLVLAGRLQVTGRDDAQVIVEPGCGVFWELDEPWTVEALEGEVRYIDVEGPALRLDHFEVA